jgi:hypothetical protein
MNSLPPEQRTMTTPVQGGHLREPIPGMEVCDFCSETPVAWAYPCGLVEFGPTVTRDPWAACSTCYALIEANDRDGLARRARETADLPVEALPVMAGLHARFFAAVLGPPVRL